MHPRRLGSSLHALARRDLTPNTRSSVLRRRLLGLFGLTLFDGVLLRPRVAQADEQRAFRVIVHLGNELKVAERGFVANAFLKKVTRWSGGDVIRVVDLRADSAARRRFTEEVLKRSVGAVRSYWQQRIFSGRDVPPPELDSDEGVIAFVAQNPAGVGYVSGAAKLVGVRELVIR